MPNPATPKPSDVIFLGQTADELTRVSLPVLAMSAACGFPSPAEDFFRPEDRLDLNERLIANAPATFICQADAGQSMVDFGIDAGDLLVVDRSLEARHGDIVVALWEGGFTLKQLWMANDRIELRASAGHQPIVVGEGVELDVWGVVRWSIRRHARR